MLRIPNDSLNSSFHNSNGGKNDQPIMIDVSTFSNPQDNNSSMGGSIANCASASDCVTNCVSASDCASSIEEKLNILLSLLEKRISQIEALEEQGLSDEPNHSRFSLDKLNTFLKSLLNPGQSIAISSIAGFSIDEAYFLYDLIYEEFEIDSKSGKLKGGMLNGMITEASLASFVNISREEKDWDSILRSDINDFDNWFKKGIITMMDDLAGQEASHQILTDLTKKSIVWMNNMETEETTIKHVSPLNQKKSTISNANSLKSILKSPSDSHSAVLASYPSSSLPSSTSTNILASPQDKVMDRLKTLKIDELCDILN